MQKLLILMFAVGPLARLSGEELIPTADGTTWLYEMTEEAGAEFSFSDAKAGADGKIHRLAAYRISGTQDVAAKTLLKFEMHRDGMITNTDLMTVNEHGIFCAARVDQYGRLSQLDPVQTIIAMPLKPGATWEFNNKVGGSNVRQHYKVLGEEDVDVRAGKFRAFHIRGEQTEPMLMTIDRWFVNGTGIVKDVTTMKMPDGDLLRRISLELKERPKIAPRPETKLITPPKKISVTVGKVPLGEATNQFGADTPKIYARWQGRDLPLPAKIRVVWVAENVAGVAPPDYTVDEASAKANSPDAHGTFTLSRPDTGWAPGDYRVDFYLEAELADSAKITISK